MELEFDNTVRVEGRERGKRVYLHEGKNIWTDFGRNWLLNMISYDWTNPPVVPPFPPDAEPTGAAITRQANGTAGSTVGSVLPVDVAYPPFPLFYIGVGIGGLTQNVAGIAPEVAAAYPGTNDQSDADYSVTGLERPVRIAVESATPVTWARWLKPFTYDRPVAPPPHPFSTVIDYFGGSKIMRLCVTTQFNGSTSTEINSAGIDPITTAPVSYEKIPITEVAIYPWYPSLPTNIIYPAPGHVLNHAVAYEIFPTVNKTANIDLIISWEMRLI